jgi:hypothetical protein
MKKIYLLILAFISFQIKAQYTITSASNPVIGDIETFIDPDTTGVFMGSSGIGQTWNYSGIVFSPTAAIYSGTYVSSASVPNNSLYPTSNIAENWGGNYDMYSNSSGAIIFNGNAVSTSSNCFVYNNPCAILNLPFSYGSSCPDTYSYTQGTTILNGTVNTTGDGTGTLILPSISVPNVLKIKAVHHQIVNIGAGTFTIDTQISRYYASVNKFFILSIQSTTTSTSSSLSIDKYVDVNTNFVTGINTSKIPDLFRVFPNPISKGDLFLNGLEHSKDYRIELYNTLGQTVIDIITKDVVENYKVDVSELNKGVYYLKISSLNSTKTQKIIIE